MLRFGRKRNNQAQMLADRARDAGDWPLAARLYREALSKRPRNAAIWVQYGHALKGLGDLGEAERAYRKSIALDGRIADSHLQLGHVLKMQGRRDDAAAAYLRAFAVDPTATHAALELYGLCWRPISQIGSDWGRDLLAFLNSIASLPAIAREQARLVREVEELRREIDRLKERSRGPGSEGGEREATPRALSAIE